MTVSAFFQFIHQPREFGGGESERRYAMAYKSPGPLKRGALEDLVLSMVRGPGVLMP